MVEIYRYGINRGEVVTFDLSFKKLDLVLDFRGFNYCKVKINNCFTKFTIEKWSVFKSVSFRTVQRHSFASYSSVIPSNLNPYGRSLCLYAYTAPQDFTK